MVQEAREFHATSSKDDPRTLHLLLLPVIGAEIVGVPCELCLWHSLMGAIVWGSVPALLVLVIRHFRIGSMGPHELRAKARDPLHAVLLFAGGIVTAIVLIGVLFIIEVVGLLGAVSGWRGN